MRTFIIFWEFLIFVPALIKVLDILLKEKSPLHRKMMFVLVMSLPPIVYIDHGHF